jgi:SAM-dependent methyltransferase
MSDAWNDNYVQGFLPWDTSEPDPVLVEYIDSRSIVPGRALDVGCGTGTHARWLASRGFDVLGVDVAPRAIEIARDKATAESFGARVRFAVGDFLATLPDGGPFDFVFDRGCFHVFEADDRARFAAQVARVLAPGGIWLSLVGSTEGAARDSGPPRRSVRDLANAIEPALEIVELRGTSFDLGTAEPPRAWACASRLRSEPAQPSSRH